ncbi:V-set and immunoglobulin domain-containing protein 4 isoform X2 [Pyxicephalus adspersus]|uniref:V-set and immunoglobulin domain-containing protein 4 isoform X2 n=1 Tax=Pyxicephalus adspersus TaxID=30357 RepID=UPI003B59AF9D
MADPRMVGHSRWLLVFILVCGFRNGLCDISLTMEKKVTGYKGESVVIPCTYTASGNVEVVKIEWEFKNGPKSELVIYRTESEDHISLIKYRNRAAISKSPTGDVSLTLKKLDISDRGNFHCKVTRKDSSGKVITKEDFSVLTILRTRPPTKKPEVTTEETEVTTTTPATTKPDGKVSTSGEDPNLTTLEILPTTKPDVKVITTEEKPEITTATPTTNNPNGKVGTTGDDPNLTTPGNPVSSLDEELTPTKNLQTVTENLVTETPKMGTETLARRDITTKILLTTKPDVKFITTEEKPEITTEDSVSDCELPDEGIITTRNPQTETGVSNDGDDRAVVTTRHPWGFHTHAVPTPTTEVVHDSAPAAASSGSGMFLYIVIIGLLCIVSVFILTIVMIVRRKKRKSFIYNIPTMNQLAINLEGRSCAGGGCQSLVESASNDYELHLPISEYESVQLCSNEYEQLVIRNPEGNGSCCHTSQ